MWYNSCKLRSKVNPVNKKPVSVIWKGIRLLLFVFLAAALGQLLWQIGKLNMLPGGYFLLLCAGTLLVLAVLGLLLLAGRRGKKSRWFRQLLGVLLSLPVLVGCLIGSRAVAQVQNAVSSITAPVKVNVVLEVYVRSDDSAMFIQDIAGYTFALPEDISEAEITPVLEELKQILGTELDCIAYPNITAQMDALFSGEVDAVILNSAYLTVLEDLEGYSDYASRIRLLHEKVVEKETAPEHQQAPILPLPERPERPQKQNGFLVYVSGVDSRRNVHSDGRSDVNILVAVNPVTHQILMLNTPRDTYVINYASPNDSMDKLTHCGLNGTANSMASLGELYGYTPEYYARINFSGFETLVDAIGGVTIYSDVSFTANGSSYIRKGENHLNGKAALDFARERKSLAGGDHTRGKNQMKLIAAIMDQLSADTILRNYSQILESLEGMFVTSMPAEEIGKLVQTQISEMPRWEIFSYAITGTGASDRCWASGCYAYVMYPDDDAVAHASELIGKILNGEELTQEDIALNP